MISEFNSFALVIRWTLLLRPRQRNAERPANLYNEKAEPLAYKFKDGNGFGKYSNILVEV